MHLVGITKRHHQNQRPLWARAQEYGELGAPDCDLLRFLCCPARRGSWASSMKNEPGATDDDQTSFVSPAGRRRFIVALFTTCTRTRLPIGRLPVDLLRVDLHT